MNVDLSKLSDDQLKLELERRQKERENRPVPLRDGWPESPVGLWKVTTEGDCEGKSTKDLGTYEGHIVDIARKLYECGRFPMYSYTFSPVKKIEYVANPQSQFENVSIQLDINSGTWDMNQEQRVASIQKWLGQEKAGFAFDIVQCNYFGSVYLKKA